jgi:thiamine biosynthesis lipoprotein
MNQATEPLLLLKPATAAFRRLGTTALVRVTDPGALGSAAAILDRQLRELDLAASRFRADSEISEMQRRSGTRVPVSPLLVELIAQGLRAARITDGIVSPALGWALVRAGYDRDFEELAAADDQVAAADPAAADGHAIAGHHAAAAKLAPVGGGDREHRFDSGRVALLSQIAASRQDWRAIELDRAMGTVCLPPGMRLDLGATAKAYAADRAASSIAQATGGGVLVSLGGDIATAGQPLAGGWPIHVGDDHRASRGPGQRLTIGSGALATSSTTVRRWLHDGRVQHHIIDPRTGRPATGRWRTVSATAGSCVDANIATTAAIVLGEAAAAWLTEAGIAARLVAAGGAVSYTCGWPQEA